MLYIGDYVRHNSFPPTEGYVSIINPGISGNQIGVVQPNGVIFYDDESSWDIVVSNTSNEEVIEAEFTVIDP